MKLFCCLVLLSFVAVFPAFAQNVSKLSAKQKYQIVKSVLSKTIFHQNNNEKEAVCFSTENIPQSTFKLFSNIKNTNIVLLTSSEIETDPKCGFEYWYFSEFKTKGSSVLVSLIKTHYVNGFQKDSGLIYSYHKKNGKWQGKITGYVLGTS